MGTVFKSCPSLLKGGKIMNAFLNLKDRLDMLYNNIDAMKSLLHVVWKGLIQAVQGQMKIQKQYTLFICCQGR